MTDKEQKTPLREVQTGGSGSSATVVLAFRLLGHREFRSRLDTLEHAHWFSSR